MKEREAKAMTQEARVRMAREVVDTGALCLILAGYDDALNRIEGILTQRGLMKTQAEEDEENRRLSPAFYETDKESLRAEWRPNNRIRRLAKEQNLKATKSRKDGRWYFVFEFLNSLESPEEGLDDDEALRWLLAGESED